MRAAVVLFVCLWLCESALGADQAAGPASTAVPATKLEAFLARKGMLIVKEFYPLGSLSGALETKAEADAVVMYEPGHEGQRVRGIRIEVTGGGRYGSGETAFLDMEEVQSLSEALEYMKGLAAKWQGMERSYTEVVFQTKGDFRIGFFQEGTKQSAFLSCGRVSRESCWLSSVEQLGDVKAQVDEGLRLLADR